MLFRLLVGGWAFLLLTGGVTATAPVPPPDLGRGINLGNALEAPREGAWGVTLQADYFRAIAQAGFRTVRVPISWSAHAAATPPYAIDPDFLARVDWVLDQALQNGLQVILDNHSYDGLLKDPDAHEERFVGLWRQIAEHYRHAPPTVLFELYNEPHGKLMTAERWNALLARTLAVVRASNPAPARFVIVGPVEWNGIKALPELVLPDNDWGLLATVHFYDPFHFTHQGAGWVKDSQPWLGTRWEGTPEERAFVADQLEKAAAWGRDHQRPVFLGEFGAYSTAPMEDRARWTAFVARTAEAKGMAWAYWEFCAGFGAYDPKAGQWRQPLLEALIPPAKP